MYIEKKLILQNQEDNQGLFSAYDALHRKGITFPKKEMGPINLKKTFQNKQVFRRPTKRRLKRPGPMKK